MPLIRFRKVGGKLVFKSSKDEQHYIVLKRSLQEGSEVEAYFDVVNADKTLAQLDKVHKVIRNISVSTGNEFDHVKQEVKRRSGLCYKDATGNENFKSFADCSKDELSLAIMIAEELSVEIGMPVF